MSKRTDGFTARLMIVLFTILVVYVFYELRYVLLVLFGAVLLAIALRGFARLLARPFGMRPKPLVPVVLVLMVFLILGGLVGFGQPLAGQINQLGDLIPGAMNSLEAIARTLGISQFGSLDNETLQNAAGTIAGRLTGMLQTGLNVVIYVVFLLFAAMFMALEPDMYREAFVRLTAPEHRDRVDAMLRDCGKALELWLRVQFITMMIVGVAIGFGLWLLGVPLALLLGLIAGLFEFVPYLGPLMSSVPAILVGLSVSAELGILVLVLFIIVNQLEGNLLIPYLQAREVNLPPLVTILSAIAFGTLFGVLGLIFAVPLGLVIMIALQRLWVEAALEEVPVEDQEPLHE